MAVGITIFVDNLSVTVTVPNDPDNRKGIELLRNYETAIFSNQADTPRDGLRRIALHVARLMADTARSHKRLGVQRQSLIDNRMAIEELTFTEQET